MTTPDFSKIDWKSWLRKQRWFLHKAKGGFEVELFQSIPLKTVTQSYWLILRVTGQSLINYSVPVVIRPSLQDALPISVLEDGNHVFDAWDDPEFCHLVYSATGHGLGPMFNGTPIQAIQEQRLLERKTESIPKKLESDQSNTCIRFGEEYFMKAYRALGPEKNPEEAVSRFLTMRQFPHSIPLLGKLKWNQSLLATLSPWCPNQGSAWQPTVDFIRSGQGDVLLRMKQIGQALAGLHLTLAQGTGPEFIPEYCSPGDLEDIMHRPQREYEALHDSLQSNMENCLPETRQLAQQVIEELAIRFSKRNHDSLQSHLSQLQLQRCHGDFHLGQVLLTLNVVIITDFEGEPLDAHRRLKWPKWKDVAGLLRSIDYALGFLGLSLPIMPAMEERRNSCRQAFLDSYFTTSGIVSEEREKLLPFIAWFELEKAVYELRYELNSRPDWLSIPLRGILQNLAQLHSA